ncbi:MAG: Co2+/Mg2+ efflux protein ApaG [Deinococcales bacterium]
MQVLGPSSPFEIPAISVQVESFPLPQHSQPEIGRYVFGYRIRISNDSLVDVQLLDRYWFITDGIGRQQEVRGKGVIGEQPMILAGTVYEYSSFCPLTTSFGYMQGHYGMRDDKGQGF